MVTEKCFLCGCLKSTDLQFTDEHFPLRALDGKKGIVGRICTKCNSEVFGSKCDIALSRHPTIILPRMFYCSHFKGTEIENDYYNGPQKLDR